MYAQYLVMTRTKYTNTQYIYSTWNSVIISGGLSCKKPQVTLCVSPGFCHFCHCRWKLCPFICFVLLCPRPHRAEALSDDASLTYVCLTSVGLSVAYIGPKSRTERPRKTKICTRGSQRHTWLGHHFKVKRSKVNLQGAGAYCGGLPHSLFYSFSYLFIWFI